MADQDINCNNRMTAISWLLRKYFGSKKQVKAKLDQLFDFIGEVC